MSGYNRCLPLLQPGDAVAVITPSGPADANRLASGCETLRSWGLEPVLGAHVNTGRGMTAGADSDRAHDLQWALESREIAAVFCARGGYGVIRILDGLDWSRIRRSTPKPVVGFSDITGLHVALAGRLGWSSILGVHVAGGIANHPDDDPSANDLRSLLFHGILPNLFSAPTRVVRGGRVRGVPLRGGNLTMLAAMCGSSDGTPPPEPFIAVLEDVNEAPYRVDRMLTQLLRAGWFENAVGVVCGSWEGCHGVSVSTQLREQQRDGDSVHLDDAHLDDAGAPAFREDTPNTELETVLVERLEALHCPLLFDAPFGHGANHLPVPIGIPVDLDTSARSLAFSN